MVIGPSTILLIVAIVVGFILLAVLFTFVPVMLWISAIAAGVRISIFTLIGMRLRRVIPSRVINPLIKAHKAGINVTINQLESHYLAGGNVDRVVNALIAAHRANIELTFERCAAIDLAGRDVLEAVQMSVNPKVIETPFIAGVAMDGIEVKAKARITVRANIDRLVGGAGEETIVARVGEGIVSTIGSSDNHKKVLENPDMISQTVLSKGLDAGTAFEILSIDIADVDIGKNIGAELQTEQAEADKNIAQAKAEERRAMAVANEQEMKARVEEMRAKVVEAEAEVPLAMAEALRSGNIGVMDYMNIKNIDADTDMRDSIGKLTGDKKDGKNPKGK
ncbi:flotillin-like protein FloA [Lysinibacillus sphaericus]